VSFFTILVYQQMCQIIMKLVTDSFLNQHYEKALTCIKECRMDSVRVRFKLIFVSQQLVKPKVLNCSFIVAFCH